MLCIITPDIELYDEEKNEFIQLKSQTLKLEHSLIAISKWEAKWKKPFLDSEKTDEEMIHYIKCMNLTPNISNETFNFLSDDNIKAISAYINDPMTATWFSEDRDPMVHRNREIVTSELIYYWMIAYNIPSEFQKWHLNRLLTLIRVCDHKNRPSKKMSKASIAKQNRDLNAQRKAMLNSKG